MAEGLRHIWDKSGLIGKIGLIILIPLVPILLAGYLISKLLAVFDQIQYSKEKTKRAELEKEASNIAQAITRQEETLSDLSKHKDEAIKDAEKKGELEDQVDFYNDHDFGSTDDDRNK